MTSRDADFRAQAEDVRKGRDQVINQVVSIFNSELKPLGFKRKGNNWLRSNETMVGKVSIDRTYWSSEFYIFVDVRFHEIPTSSERKKPPPHIIARLKLENDDTEFQEFYQATHYESGIASDRRQTVLGRALRSRVVPFLKRFESIETIVASLKESRLELPAMIQESVYSHFGLRKSGQNRGL
jgi:hypothetical protein